MSVQPCLFDAAPLPPYRGRTPTARACSKAASIAALRFGPTQEARALAWWRSQGRRGGTDPECSEATGISRASLCQRRRALIEVGKLVATTRTRRNRGGYRCMVWIAAEFAEEA